MFFGAQINAERMNINNILILKFAVYYFLFVLILININWFRSRKKKMFDSYKLLSTKKIAALKWMSITGVVLFLVYCKSIGWQLNIINMIRGADYKIILASRLLSNYWIENRILFRVWHILVRICVSLVAFILYSDYVLHQKLKLKYKGKFFLCFIILFVILIRISDGQKLPIVILLFQFYAAYTLAMGNEYFSLLKKIKKYIFLAFTFLLIPTMYYLYFRTKYYMDLTLIDALFQEVFPAVFRRISLTQSKALAIIFDVFPSELNHLYGATFPNLGILPFTQFDLSSYCYKVATGTTGGGMTTCFVGELYANFGIPGILFGIPLVLSFLKWLHNKLFCHRRNSLYIGVYAFLCGVVPLLSLTQIFMGLAMPLCGVVIIMFICHPAKFIGQPGKPPVTSRVNATVTASAQIAGRGINENSGDQSQM